jgi:hypothetical protein
MEVADAVLLPHCINYQIGSATAIEILPGESEQFLHTDDIIYPLRVPGATPLGRSSCLLAKSNGRRIEFSGWSNWIRRIYGAQHSL